ncbi:MAG: isochorismate synthase, partial [Candidatus Didemnitutus sp.]|nr:isochorismate synthase [Candidatus Didemnitutus sp.]
MKHLPVNPTDNPTPEALRAFLGECAELARTAGQPQLVSISMGVESLDPLAVLESIFEPTELHFYVERPSAGFAVAGAEAVVEFTASGSGRLGAAKEFIQQTLEQTVAVGPLQEDFAGPHFFITAGFSPEAAADAAFPALRVFVPRWQVSRLGDGSVAVANLVIT